MVDLTCVLSEALPFVWLEVQGFDADCLRVFAFGSGA